MADQQRGANQPTWNLANPYQVTVQTVGGVALTQPASIGISRGTGADWFGPLNPMGPSAPPEVAGRRFDFPSGYNLAQRPRNYEPVGFEELRWFADAYDLLRLVIETRKDQLERMQWAIKPRDPKLQRKASKLSPDIQGRVDTLTQFWRKPDGVTSWKPWIRDLLEDVFVIDAPTLYCQRTRAGGLCGLRVLDGSRIKRVIDDWGGTPMPYRGIDGAMVYPPAYQHVLKGLPAVNYSTRDIIYRPRNKRPHKVYGYSPVQQVLLTVQIGLRRQMWQLDYYTEGSIPDALIGVPDTWTPEQIAQYQRYWDTEFVGDMAKRRRAKFVPGVTAAKVHETKQPEQKNDFDEWLVRIVCFAFSVPPSWAVKMRSAASDTSKQSDQSDEEGIEPTKEYVKDLVDDVIADEFNSPDLEFTWIEQGDVDPVKQEALLEGRVKTGAIVLNEFRDALGLDPYPDPAANKPMVLTPTGYIPIDANTIEGKQANIDAFGMPPAHGAAPQGGEQPPAAAEKKPIAQGKEGGDDNADKLNGRIPFTKRKRRHDPIPFDRVATRKALTVVAATFAKAFAKLKPRVIAEITGALGKVAKDKKPKTRARQIVSDLDLSILVSTAGAIGDELAAVGEDGAQLALAQVGVTDASDLVDQVNEAAVAYARDRAADLVGMKYDDDGSLIENPDPEFAITESTRDMLRDIISDGLAQNIGTDAIADNIAASGVFSDDRADLIARTEVSRANSQAALEGYRTARDKAGVNVKKQWLLGPNPCPICEDNADDGDIDLDDVFSSGDDSPPAHPNCECALSPLVED